MTTQSTPNLTPTPDEEADLDRQRREQAAVVLFNNADCHILAAGLLLIVHELRRAADVLAAQEADRKADIYRAEMRELRAAGYSDIDTDD